MYAAPAVNEILTVVVDGVADKPVGAAGGYKPTGIQVEPFQILNDLVSVSKMVEPTTGEPGRVDEVHVCMTITSESSFAWVTLEVASFPVVTALD